MDRKVSFIVDHIKDHTWRVQKIGGHNETLAWTTGTLIECTHWINDQYYNRKLFEELDND